MPLVTVLMPVYNAEKYLHQAIDSVLGQTYRDFILLVIDDGSTDGTHSILKDYAARDERLKVVYRSRSGFLGAITAGMGEVDTQYVARMDADDVCKPKRLEVQIEFLESHPECVLVGCSYLATDSDGEPLCLRNNPLTHEEIDSELLHGRCHVLTHPCVTFRTDAFRRVGGYTLVDGEDIDLFLRLAEIGQLANVPDVLMLYRQHWQSISLSTKERQVEAVRTAAVAARRRRGLPDNWQDDGTFSILTRDEQQAMWAYQAMHGKNFKVARKHAYAVVRLMPWRLQYWRLLAAACARTWFDPSAPSTS